MRKTCLGWTPACPFAWLRSRAFLPRSNWLSLEKPASFILSINWCILAGIAQLCCLSFGNTIMWDEKCRCATCCISPVTRLRFPEVRQFIFFFFCPFIFSKSAAPWQAWEENVVGLFAPACAWIDNFFMYPQFQKIPSTLMLKFRFRKKATKYAKHHYWFEVY